MKTDNDLERRLRDVLRQTLDREIGPDPAWDDSPASQRVAKQDPRRPSRWTVRLLAVAALIALGGGAALILGNLDDPPLNGWIAYSFAEEGPAPDYVTLGDQDIWFVSLDGEPYRVIGSGTNGVDELCPAFSPDGRHLAYGRVVGQDTQYHDAALVIVDVSDDGRVSEQFTIDLGDGLPPPCPLWSPDGDRIAFGVPQTSVINPTQPAEGSEVWILTLADRSITVLSDLLATDLEFSPDGSLLAVASGMEYVEGEGLADGRIHLYELASGTTRTLGSTLGAMSFTWSPDGERIAYMTGDYRHGLMLIDLATEEQRALSGSFTAVHGIGPVWSADGESIVYQRCLGGCNGEDHDVVLVWPDDLSAEGTPREEIIPLIERAPDGSERALRGPYWVTWSPDGEYLMFAAWSSEIDPLLGVVPAVPGSPSDILVNDQDLIVNPVYSAGPFVPIQTWQHRPAGAVMPSEAVPPDVTPTSAPSPSAWVGLPAGPHLLTDGTDGGVPITVTIAAPRWNGEPNGGSLCWGDPPDPCADPSGGVGLLAFEGREYSVYGEACTWASAMPDTPATAVDELIDALANQGSRAEGELGPAGNVTVDGYAGKRIFLPMHPVDIAACDEGHVAMFGLPGIDPARYTQDQDLIEEVWAVDVDGLIVVLDATYYADTPQDIVDELRAILASATFE